MSTATAGRTITANDRLGLTLFLALAFHALIILGVGFEFEDPARRQRLHTLDVTLVHSRSEEAPEQPDYLAQENQQGAGDTRERVRPTRSESIPSPADIPGPSPSTAPPASPRPPQKEPPRVITRAPSDQQVQPTPDQPRVIEQERADAAQLIRLGKEIARLEARIDATQHAYSQRPKPRFLNANTRKFEDAAYLNAWTQKVERIGNLNYPDEARQRGLSGSLIMEVTLRPDGSLAGIRVLEPSDHPVLDEAAARIVRLAAPFAKVPAGVLGEHNELRITRTWVFTSRNELISR